MKIHWINWKTGLSGTLDSIAYYLTLLAAAPYTLGDVAMYIPPDLKAVIFKYALYAGVALKILNSLQQKSRNVSGNAARGFEVAKGNDEIKIIESTSPDLKVTVVEASQSAVDVEGHRKDTPNKK